MALLSLNRRPLIRLFTWLGDRNTPGRKRLISKDAPANFVLSLHAYIIEGVVGFGAEIAFRVQERLFGRLKGPIKRVAAKDAHIPANPVLEAAVLPSADEIVACIRQLVG